MVNTDQSEKINLLRLGLWAAMVAAIFWTVVYRASLGIDEMSGFVYVNF